MGYNRHRACAGRALRQDTYAGPFHSRRLRVKDMNYGGQAVIEGVMMRGSKSFAVAVRTPAGDISVHTEPLTAGIYTKAWGKWPIVRGLTMLWDSLGLGMRALMYSADVSLGEDEEVKFSGPVAWFTIAVSLALGIGLFFLLPSALAKLMDQFIRSDLLSSLVEGLIRIILFVGYIALIGRWKEIGRVFAYHGAEHKTINAYEAGVDLDVDSVSQYSTRHTRCGTSFLLIVLVLSILLFAPFRFPQWHWRLLSRIVLVPVVAGVSYEFIKYAARHQKNRLICALVSPGLSLQALTTREPDRGMVEVAIAALRAVLGAENEDMPAEEERTSSPSVPEEGEPRAEERSPAGSMTAQAGIVP
jgi:uncharacterized protein YqhQ